MTDAHNSPSTAATRRIVARPSTVEQERRAALAHLTRTSPIPDAELDGQLALYCTRPVVSRMLYMRDLYERILTVPGVIMELGIRWGQNLATLSSLRGIYEPYNYSRTLVGFDTFRGFPSTGARDGTELAPGDYDVGAGYLTHLRDVLGIHESLNPVAHIPKIELVEGDVVDTLPGYLSRNPQTVIALAYFDLDLYAPTKACLEAILPRVPKGGIIALDEVNHPSFPGETLALLETVGLRRHRLHRSPLHTYGCWLEVGDDADSLP